MILRREDDSLTDKLALLVLGDIDGVSTRARSTANKGALGGCGPATMADVGLGDLGGIGVGGGASKHAETLRRVNPIERHCGIFALTFLNAVVLPLGM